MRCAKLKGVLTLPMNMLGWVAMITVFAVIMMFILGFLVQFQTVPKEAVEKPTACDVAYMISLWNDAVVHPNVFNKTFLNEWEVSSIVENADPATNPASTEKANSDDTANIIFEKYSHDFFMPDSDIYLEITSKDKIYKMYLPPESKSVFAECARPTYTTTEPVPGWSMWDFFRTGEYFEQKRDYEAYKKDMTSYNAIRAECQLPSFVAGGNDIQPASVKAGLTTNLATRLRDGIYRVGVSGDKSAYYPLGSYPEGCIVNDGAVRVEEKKPSAVLGALDMVKGIIGTIFDPLGIQKALANIFGGAAKDWYADNRVVASCGFNWNYERTCQITCKSEATFTACEAKTSACRQISCDGNILTCPVNPTLVSGGGQQPTTYQCSAAECTTTDLGLNKLTVFSRENTLECPLVTRIPNYIVEESSLSDKLCTPKAAFTRVWLPKEDFSNYQYFLKVESARSSWTEKDELSFCRNRCKEAGPWWWVGDRNAEDCQDACEDISQGTKDGKKDPKEVCQERVKDPKKNQGRSKDAMRMNCNFARELIHLYRNLPEDAINIRYIVVKSETLQEKSFAELTEQDYYSTDSACGTWKSICDLAKEKQSTASDSDEPACCASAQDCSGLDCVAGQCEKCSEDYWGFCSPSYLDYPVSLGIESRENGLFKCQNVYDPSYPSNTRMNECLPALKVSLSKDSGKDAKGTDLPDISIEPKPDGTYEAISCSQNKDLALSWKIDASGLCCPEGESLTKDDGTGKQIELKDEGGNPIRVCSNPPDYCLNMKFWPNLNSTNATQMIPQQIFYSNSGETKNAITSEDYIFEVVQRVCRADKPFNNANVAFVTANYPVNGKTFQYSVEGSEIELRI